MRPRGDVLVRLADRVHHLIDADAVAASRFGSIWIWIWRGRTAGIRHAPTPLDSVVLDDDLVGQRRELAQVAAAGTGHALHRQRDDRAARSPGPAS